VVEPAGSFGLEEEIVVDKGHGGKVQGVGRAGQMEKSEW
jgi:hypothetical protein